MSQRYYSNIYWHFTGSPAGVDWSKASCPKYITDQNPILSNESAARTLNLIINSHTLKATCTEKISERKETDPFCCVTDIPLKDLPSHAPYYGKVAIGFKAQAIHKHFVPVLYIPKQNLPIIEKLLPNRELVKRAFQQLEYQGSFQEQQAKKLLAAASYKKEVVEEIDDEVITGFLANFIKITNFDTDPENTYYREREWRGIGDFSFQNSDIEAVVAPSDVLPIIKKKLQELNIENVNIISWEFIENS